MTESTSLQDWTLEEHDASAAGRGHHQRGMPRRERQQARQCSRSSIEKQVEARRGLAELQHCGVREIDAESHGVRRLASEPISAETLEVGPARRGDAAPALPERKARRDNHDAAEVVWCRRGAQLLTKPGRARTCDGDGSNTTAAMPP